MPPSIKPVDELRAIAAPRELLEWVRKLAPESAARSAWVDAPRADWVPYLAVIRGISKDVILRAVCETALEVAPAAETQEMTRLHVILQAGTTRGRDAFVSVETDLADLRRTMVESQTAQASPGVVWMFWAEVVFELARSQGRGNPLVGLALVMRLLATTKGKSKPTVKPGHTDLVARLRDKLTLAM